MTVEGGRGGKGGTAHVHIGDDNNRFIWGVLAILGVVTLGVLAVVVLSEGEGPAATSPTTPTPATLTPEPTDQPGTATSTAEVATTGPEPTAVPSPSPAQTSPSGDGASPVAANNLVDCGAVPITGNVWGRNSMDMPAEACDGLFHYGFYSPPDGDFEAPFPDELERIQRFGAVGASELWLTTEPDCDADEGWMLIDLGAGTEGTFEVQTSNFINPADVTCIRLWADIEGLTQAGGSMKYKLGSLGPEDPRMQISWQGTS